MAKYLSLCLLALGLASGFAQSEEEQAWMASMTPGAEHQWLAEMAGEWKTEANSWMDPASEPIHSEGTAKIEMAMGGRYQISHHSSTMMGMPFSGMGILAYDNVLKKFTTTWIDNFGTGILYGEGSKNADGVLVILGTMANPVDGKPLPYRYETKVESPNKVTFAMYMGTGDHAFKTMEMTYSR
ncbi:MAG: DUF1579 domain-containing protein [Acidobacteria bacterium]|nr:DUF1579 domain-containing protein [Acidobacteriota bacterium]MCB9399171.1 DUF1579 domain-containing protein [Acidobacteriota bacterium]